MAKRYVLFESDSDIEVSEEMTEFFRGMFGEAKLIEVEGHPRFVIVKTTDRVAARFRELHDGLVVRGNRLRPVLTSGAVGNLKRRAAGAGPDGQVHE